MRTKLKKKKKDEVLPFATTWMDLECMTLSKISQMEKEKLCMILLIRGMQKQVNKDKINKTYQTKINA